MLKGDGRGRVPGPAADRAGGRGAPRTILAGDFNRDGIPDLAIGRQDPNDVAVELNLGGGLFADPGTIVLAAHNTPIVADLSGDGIPDVTIVDAAGDILFRQGRADRPGSFDPPIIVNPGAPSRAIASVRTSQGVLLASVDAANNAGGPGPGTISLFAYRNGQFTRVSVRSDWPVAGAARVGRPDRRRLGRSDRPQRGRRDAHALSEQRSRAVPRVDSAASVISVGLSTSDFTVSDVDRGRLARSGRHEPRHRRGRGLAQPGWRVVRPRP